MRKNVERLLDELERGVISRAQFAQAVTSLAQAEDAPAATPAVFAGRSINHLTFRVADLERSRQFYQDMFGLTMNKKTHDGYILGMGRSFLGIYQGSSVGFDHACFGVENYEIEQVMARLTNEFPQHKPRSLGERAFVYDPDGFKIQLSSVDYPGV